MENTNLFHAASISNSILGKNVSIGGKTHVADRNFNYDGKKFGPPIRFNRSSGIASVKQEFGALIGNHVQLGLDVTINPGKKIGARTVIYPGITLFYDIPEKSRVRTDQKIEVIVNE